MPWSRFCSLLSAVFSSTCCLDSLNEFSGGFIVCFMALLFVMNLVYLIALQSGMIHPAAVGPLVLDAPGIFVSSLVTFLGTMVLVYSFIYRKNNHFDLDIFYPLLCPRRDDVWHGMHLQCACDADSS